jgi:imidazolonepropionase-like amidohydrolase
MTNSELIKNQSVLIENGIIQKIGTDIQNQNATIIDGTGKFLMPGLTDMHVHLYNNHPLKNTWIILLLINGVTNVRDMGGEPEKIVLKQKIIKNEILAPNLYQAGPIIDGKKDEYGLFAVALTPEQGRELVAQQKKSGYDFIKVYDGLRQEVYEAIMDEAKKQKIDVVGHVPNTIAVSKAIESGQKSIEHLIGYKTWKNWQVSPIEEDYAAKTASSETWNCPTFYNLALNGSIEMGKSVITDAKLSELLPDGLIKIWGKRMDGISKEAMEMIERNGANNTEVMRTIVLNLYKSNSRLIAGTDAGNLPFLVPGHSLHQELRLMTESGIPTYEVLKMTTINAALAMNKDTEFGSVEVGKRADLLLLNSNPLDNIENLQNRSGLMIRGIWLSEEEIKIITDKIKLAFGK